MTVPAFLEELRSRNVRVWTEGDQLRCTAPAGVLTPALRDQLRQEKSAIVAFLRSAEALAKQDPAIVPLQPKGRRIPVFIAPGHNGNVFSLRFLAQQLGEDQPLFGLQPPGVDGEREPLTEVEELAVYFAGRIRAFRPEGPYILAGHCAGGTIVFEVARQLQQQGASVAFVAQFGSPFPTLFRPLPQFLWRIKCAADWIRTHLRALAPLSNRERFRYIAAKLAERRRQRVAAREAATAPPDPELVRRAHIEAVTLRALSRYTPRPFAGRLLLFYPNDTWLRPGHPMLHWRGLAREVEEYCGPGDCQGNDMLHEPNVEVFARQFEGWLRRVELGAASPAPSQERTPVANGAGRVLLIQPRP